MVPHSTLRPMKFQTIVLQKTCWIAHKYNLPSIVPCWAMPDSHRVFRTYRCRTA